MEERSAAAFGNDGSEEEEELFEEGYEGDLVLTVRHGDLIPPQPHLHAVGTRRQKTLAGERLLLPARCKDKNCWQCQVKSCTEIGEPVPCQFCEMDKFELCLRRSSCPKWSREQAEQLTQAREVQLALAATENRNQILPIGAIEAAPSGDSRGAVSLPLRGEEDDRASRAIVIRVEPRTGTKKKTPPGGPADSKAPMSLAARPFVTRHEDQGRYFLSLDLNQVAFPFHPEEYEMTITQNRLTVSAIHQNAEAGEKNTPTRSKLAGQKWEQEFEVPPAFAGLPVYCLINPDNIAVICFGGEEAERVDQDAPSQPLGGEAGRRLAEPASRSLVEREQVQRDGQEVETSKQLRLRIAAWQQEKLDEIERITGELDRGYQQVQEAEGDEREEEEDVRGGEERVRREEEHRFASEEERAEQLRLYRDKWNRAKQIWGTAGMPVYPEEEPAGDPGRSVHWEVARTEPDSFYSITETPKMPPDIDVLPRRSILRANKVAPPEEPKPWDRGGVMFDLPAPPPQPQLSRRARAAVGYQISATSTPATSTWMRGAQTGHNERPQSPLSSRLTPEHANLYFPTSSRMPFTSPQRPTVSMPQRQEPRGGGADRPEQLRDGQLTNSGRERYCENKGGSSPDQLGQVLTLLTDRLTKYGGRGAEKPSTLKLPSVSLPKIKRDSNDQCSVRAWYSFKHSLYTCVDQHHLDTNVILLHYATDSRLLPSSMQEVFQTSESLQEAISLINSRFPPIASLHSELIRELLSFPPLESTTEKAKILRIGKLLNSLEEFLRFFKGEASLDISRDKVLVILHNLAGAQEYKQELLREVAYMDEKRRGGQLYGESLKEFLLRHRLMYVDLNSALQIVGTHNTSSKNRSAALRHGKRGSGEKRGAGDKEALPERDNCALCLKAKHKAWACQEELQKVLKGSRPLPSHICAVCLEEKKSGHPARCSIVRSKHKGVYYLYDNRCPKCSINIKICPCTDKAMKKVDPNQDDKSVKSQSAAVRVKVLMTDEADESESDAEDGGEETQRSRCAAAISAISPDVVFLSEEVLILGRDNQTRKLIISYDSHSSSHHCTPDLRDDFNWGPSGETETISMLTVAGEVSSQMGIYRIKILTLNGILQVTALEGNWADVSQEPQLSVKLAEENNITIPGIAAEGEAIPRLILGCGEILSFPKKVATSPKLAKEEPKIAVYQSKLTGNLLACGQLSRR